MRFRRLALLWTAATTAVAFGAADVARDRARAALAQEVLVDARLRGALLDSEVARYRLVPLALGGDRDVAAVAGKGVSPRRRGKR